MKTKRKKGAKRSSSTLKLIKGLVVKNEKTNDQCLSLRPFEKEFEKQMSGHLIKTNEQYKKKIAKQLFQKFAPTSITPNNDFYNYINYTWLKSIQLTEKQKYIVQIDDFRLSQDRVYTELDTIITNYIKENKNELSNELSHYRKSVIQMNDKTQSRLLAKSVVNNVNSICDQPDNLWKLLADINSDEMIASGAPFVWNVNPNEQNPTQYCCYLFSHSFSLTDLDVYFDQTTPYSKNYIHQFKKYCKSIFDVTLGKHDFDTDAIFEIECLLINAFGCEDIKSTNKTYNKITKQMALEEYGFDWETFCRELGYKEVPNFFVVTSVQYLKCVTKLLRENWNSPKWRAYWVWIYLQRIVRITRDWESITFDFHGSFQRGQTKINNSDSVSAALYMSVPFNTFLTNQYIKQYKNPKTIEYVKTLCEDLKIVFMRIIKRNKWLSEKTKKYALLKLTHMEFLIGHMKSLREDPLLHYTDSLYDNMKKIHQWRHQKLLLLNEKPLIDIPMMDWNEYPVKMAGNQAYIVNASYTPAKNSIFVNLGYLQRPFIDLEERGIEYNLANLGITIGHELSHSLDAWGSQYDYKGRLYNWWTPKDKKVFLKIQEDVNEQYKIFSERDKIHYDVTIGIGENMADISTVAICDEYLRDYQEKNNTHPAVRSLSYEAFYTYYAYQMRQHVNKRALSAQLKNNPHALDKYRTNIPLSRSQIFRALFNIKKGDKMWWRNTNTIW